MFHFRGLTLLSEAESNKLSTVLVRLMDYPAGSVDLMHAETFNDRNLGGPGMGLSPNEHSERIQT